MSRKINKLHLKIQLACVVLAVGMNFIEGQLTLESAS